MKKVRVFELAKEYGMKGPEMATLLRDQLGFDQVTSHMASLDPADEIQVVARLEASGYHRKATATTEVEDVGSPQLKKKRLPGADGGSATAIELEPEPRPKALKELPKKQLPKPVLKRAKKVVESAAPEAEAASAAAVEAPAAEPAEPVAAKPAEPAVAPEPEARQPAAQPVAAPPAKPPAKPAAAKAVEAEPKVTPQEAPAAAAAAAEAPRAKAGATPPRPATRPEEIGPAALDVPPEVKRLLVPKAKAQVVGRIELPQETIRDATRRSAPPADRNAARDLRRAALKNTQQRTATRVSSGRGRPGGGRGGRDSGRGPQRRSRSSMPASLADPNKEVEIEAPVSIKAFSEALGVKITELIAALTFKLGLAGKNINSFLSTDEVELVALALERKVRIVEYKKAEDQMLEQLVEVAAEEDEAVRAPVVTFMGHVDHGKTSLIDRMRRSDIAKGEAGGITQHIGAYKVTTEKGQSFVILDTPGHAAFTAMRARGATLTDVVILVVAADDGVMPQTEEAINHAKAAEVPFIVAINKCDLPGANPMQVKQQLMVKGLQPEEWGGSTGMVEVSAMTGKGIDELVDRIMLEAEILELKARHSAAGRGIVVESKQTPEQGVIVTVLVTDGTMRVKDQVVCGESFSRVRGMIDDHGRQVMEAGPATPVTLLGLDRLPMPGDKLYVVEDAKKARVVVGDRQRRARDLSLAERSAVTLETLSARLAEQDMEEIKIILKADVMGSLEPLRKCLEDLSTKEVRVNMVHSALGGINETDVSLAAASGAIIVGFNTIADSSARQAAERAGVELRYYEVIYQLLDDMRLAMEGLLAPEEVESVVGHAEIRAVFKSSKFGTIAGCYVTDGVVRRGCKARLSRDSKVVWSGKIASLRREKDDAKEVRAGFECGMTLHDYQDIKEGDQLEFLQIELVKRALS